MKSKKIPVLSLSLLLLGCSLSEPLPNLSNKESKQPQISPSDNTIQDKSQDVNTDSGSPQKNNQPVLIALTANPNELVSKDGQISFEIQAADKDKDELRYTWAASSGLLSSDKGKTVKWRPIKFDGTFEKGITLINVTVDDNRGGITTGAINVTVTESGLAKVKAISTQESQNTKVTSIEGVPDFLTLKLGNSEQLKAKAIFEDGSSSDKLFWFSSNSEILDVNSSGQVTRVGSGDAYVIVLSDADLKTTYKILVRDPDTEQQNISLPETSQPPSSTPQNQSSSQLLPPTGLKSLNVSSQALSVSWNTSNNAQSYRVYLNGQLSQNTAQNAATLGDLTPNTPYNVQVSTLNAQGESSLSEALLVTTSQLNLGSTEVAPPQPSGLTLINSSNNSLSLSWQPIAEAQTYSVYLDGQEVASGLTSPQYTYLNLQANTTYSLQVKAFNQVGESSLSQSLSGKTTLSVTGAPTGLSANSINDTSFILNWNPVENVSSYKVYRNGELAQSNIVSNSYEITGLTASSTYQMSVSAVNSAGESAQSVALSVTTQAAQAPLSGKLVFSNGVKSLPLGNSVYSFSGLESQVSPDQSKALYYSEVGNDYEVFVSNIDGSNSVNISNHNQRDRYPIWSPSGSTVAFVSDRGVDAQGVGFGEIYLMNPDGSSKVRLTHGDFRVKYMRWSPNGNSIVFESGLDGEIYKINVDGNGLVKLTQNPGFDSKPQWSPDSSKILYVASDANFNDVQYYTVNADGSNKIRLTSVQGDKSHFFSWSPNGNKVLLAMRPQTSLQIFTVNPDGSNLLSLTNQTQSSNQPVWSPDGQKIAYVSNQKLMVMNSDGSAKTEIPAASVTGELVKWLP